jgi:hypothetical protein
VPVPTLAQVLAENNVPPNFEFLKVDVEGLEQAVLAGNDWQRFRPHVVMIEATVPETRIRRQDGCRAFLTGVGWRHAWFDVLNDWYLAPDIEPPNGAFDAPPNVFDHYVTRRTAEAEAQLAELRRATEVHDGRIRQLETVAAARAGVLSLLTEIVAEAVRGGRAEIDMTRVLGSLRQSPVNMGGPAAGDDLCVTAAVQLAEADNARLCASLADVTTDLKKHSKALSQVQDDLIPARKEVTDARAATNHFRELLNQAQTQSAAALAELQAQFAATHAEVHALRTSTSWRVSAPVRALGRILRRR